SLRRSKLLGLDQQIGFFISNDLSSYLFSKFGFVGVHVPQVILKLEADAYAYTKIISPLRVFFWSTRQKSPVLERKTQQDRRLQPDHVKVFFFRHLIAGFEIHVKLLPFTYLCRRPVKMFHAQGKFVSRNLKQHVICPHHHHISGKNRRVGIPFFMDRGFSSS